MRWSIVLALLALLALQAPMASASEDVGDGAPDGDEEPYGDEPYDSEGGGENPEGDFPSDGEGGYPGGDGDDDEPSGGGPSSPPPSEELADVAALDAFLDNNDASVIGAFKSSDDAELQSFEEIASSMQYDWRFAHSTDAAVLERVKAKGGGVFMFRSPRYVSEKHGDRPRERFPSAKLSASAVKNWLLSKAQPLVGQFTYSTKDRYLHTKLPVVILFVDINWATNAKGTGYYLNRARKVAEKYKDKLQFALAHMGDYEYQMADWGLKVEDKMHDVRVGLLHKVGDEELYYGCAETKFTTEILTKFADEYLADVLTPSKRQDTSTPPPRDEEDEGGDVHESSVVTLTSANFEEVVQDATKDVLIEFYAPWCGHCKALVPEYAKAAKELAGTPSVVLAKMDATAHDPPQGFDVQGYPTLLFVPAEAGAKPVPYDGERTAAEMVSWLKSNAKSLK